VSDERRCPSCEALVSPDAEWCGQCFASLVEAPPEPAPPTVAAPPEPIGAQGEGARPGWPCGVCGTWNAIEADACLTCGTPFATLMREDPERPQVEPKDAVAWSLLFPGLGHRAAGRSTDGVARGVVFGLAFGMSLLVGFAGVRSGPAFGVFLLLLGSGLAIYILSAFEAYRLASGEDLLVSSRVLMWILVGVIFLAIALLALAVVSATRR
jgi:hypothetical protein